MRTIMPIERAFQQSNKSTMTKVRDDSARDIFTFAARAVLDIKIMRPAARVTWTLNASTTPRDTNNHRIMGTW